MQQSGGALHPLINLRFGQALEPQTKSDVLENRKMGKEGIVLEHHRHVAFRRVLKGDVASV